MTAGACILHWALHKEHPWCPQCKQPFTYLLTYRGLDGELHDFPVEESVVLLKRARWFEDAMKANERAAALLDDSRLADDNAWQDYADEYDLAEDEEIEAFYFSSAAGRARVTLGNRRFGEGGYIAGGRRQARPVPTPPTSRKGKTAKGSGGKPPRKAGTAGAGPSTSSAAVAIQTPNANGGHVARAAATASPSGMSPQLSAGSFGCGTSPGCGSLVYGSSPSGSGRRAKRNARRAAASVGTPSPGASMQPVGFAAVVGGE